MPSESPTRWSLADLLPQPVEKSLEQALKKLERAAKDFERMRPALEKGPTAAKFAAALKQLELVANLKSRVEGYADLWFTEDTQKPAALNMRDRVDQVVTDVANRCLYFDLWFKDLSPTKAASLMKGSGDLRYYLETLRRFKPYTLSEAEEKTINSKDVNGIDAVVGLYELITNGLEFKLEVDGETKTLTRDELAAYFQNPSAELRKRAYQELFRVYGENSTVLAQMYIHRARDWHSEGIEMRGYKSPIGARNLENDLPDKVVETLLTVCRKNAGLFQEYFQLKAKWLGMAEFARYDIYAPLTPSDKKFSWTDCTRMVFESYGAFSPDVAALAKRVFDENHVDAQIRSGKRGGAFCYTAMPSLTPWVLINYQERARDIATLAHELGHAIHAMLANKHSVLTQLSSLPLAETASVFGEMLLTDRLLEHESDVSVRRELLANALDDAYITVMRQAYFTIFEKEAHDMIVEGASLDELTEHYLANLKEQFGKAVQVPDDFKWEWIGVPHFYNAPFYTYAYSFGQLLVLALYQKYKQEGTAFLPKYLRLLTYGGSEAPLKVLRQAGLDVTSPAFWQGGFDFLRNMLDDLKKLS
jgi:oligoendopeptidase F